MPTDNIIPLNEDSRRALEAADASRASGAADTLTPQEQAVAEVRKIEELRRAALEAMSGLVLRWSSKDPVISALASAAITDVMEATQMKPPTA